MIKTLHVTTIDQSGSQYYDCEFHFGSFFSGRTRYTLFVGENKSYVMWPTNTHAIRNVRTNKTSTVVKMILCVYVCRFINIRAGGNGPASYSGFDWTSSP